MKTLAATLALLAAPAVDATLRGAREAVRHPIRSILLGIPAFWLYPLDVTGLVRNARRRPLRAALFLGLAIATAAIPGTTAILAPIEARTR